MNKSSSIYLSVEQVAARLGVSKDSIWRWRREGDFPAPHKFGGRTTRWRLSDIEDWENQCSCHLMYMLNFPQEFPRLPG